jgi:hypothetical protein
MVPPAERLRAASSLFYGVEHRKREGLDRSPGNSSENGTIVREITLSVQWLSIEEQFQIESKSIPSAFTATLLTKTASPSS